MLPYVDALDIISNGATPDNSIKRIKFGCVCGEAWIEIILETMPGSRLIKIGQYPDAVDFDNTVNGDIMKVALKDECLYRLSAAKAYYVGLYIAAFNYLRRVFESLVAQAEAQAGIGCPKSKMKERVKELVSKKALNQLLMEPGFNVLYTLLSKGVHELSEDECCEQYHLLQETIDTILEDKLQEQLQQQRKERLSKSLNKLNSGRPKS